MSEKYYYRGSTSEEMKALHDIVKKKNEDRPFMRTQQDVSRYCADMHLMSREVMRILFVDASNRVIGQHEAFGSTSHCTVYPRDIFKEAMALDANGIFVTHNHPGGASEPSPADWIMTKRIFEIGELLDINLIDHIIMHGDDCSSLRGKSQWPQSRK